MKETQEKESEVVLRDEDGVRYLEIKLSKRLEREMRKLVEQTAGTLHA